LRKTINPDLLRNSIFPSFTGFNNIIESKNANSLILFQDIEIKSNLIQFLKTFGVSILNINIIRSFNMLSINFDYIETNALHKYKTSFFKRIISRLNNFKYIIFNYLAFYKFMCKRHKFLKPELYNKNKGKFNKFNNKKKEDSKIKKKPLKFLGQNYTNVTLSSEQVKKLKEKNRILKIKRGKVRNV
jgi:hypothetical protein